MQCPSCRVEFALQAGSPDCPSCGFSFVNSYYSRPELAQGSKLNNRLYTVQSRVGLGAWSIVYLAVNGRDGSQVAIKEYFPPGYERDEAGSVVPHGAVAVWELKKGLSQVAHEAELMTRFVHRSLLSCIDFFQENGTAYIVTEYVQGETLQQMATREGGRLPESQIMPYLEQMFAALNSLNRAKVVHGDIKPENILVTPEGRVVLIDFGAAVEFSRASLAGEATPAYAAPEQLDSAGTPGLGTDLYGLCATVYHLLTGVLPTPAKKRMKGARLAKPPERLISAPLMENLSRGMKLKQMLRPTIAQMRQALFAAFAPKVKITPMAVLKGHEKGLVSLDFSADSKYMISADEGGTVLLWRIEEILAGRAHPMRLFQHRGLTQAGFSPDGQLVASSSRQGSLKMWAPPSGRELERPLIFDADPIVGFAFSPAGGDMAVGYADGTAQLWRQPGRLVYNLEGHSSAITSLAFSPDGTILATSSTDKTTSLWDMSTGRLSHLLTGHTRLVQDLAFSPDGELLATASHDRSTRLWEVSTGREKETILGQSGAIIGVKFVPMFGGFLTASGDGKIKVMRLNPTTEVAAVTRNVIVRALACADGGLFATANGDKTIQLWGISG